jgi:hypothetical protein
MDQIISLHQLVSNAIVLTPENATEDDNGDNTNDRNQAEAA